jgi:hypothetical protein
MMGCLVGQAGLRASSARTHLEPAGRAQCRGAAVAAADLVQVLGGVIGAKPLEQSSHELVDGALANARVGLLADAQDRQRVRRELADAVVHQPPLAQCSG